MMKKKYFIFLVMIVSLLACGCVSNNQNADVTTTSISTTTAPATTILETITTISASTTVPEVTTTLEVAATTTTIEKRSCASACSSDYGASGYSGSFLCYSKQPANYCPTSIALVYYLPASSTTCPSTQGCWCGIRENCSGRCSAGVCTNSTG